MVAAINIALSGLTAASKRIEVASQNLASQSATRTQRDGQVTNQPYVPQDVVQLSEAAGGTQALSVPAANPVTRQYQPEHPDADPAGFVKIPNVDTAEQLVNIQMASYDFKANLKVLQAQDEIAKSTLDILS
jgi:flagellar basal-body rod protein FlgC